MVVKLFHLETFYWLYMIHISPTPRKKNSKEDMTLLELSINLEAIQLRDIYIIQ